MSKTSDLPIRAAVLVVDDEPMVLNLVVCILERAGFKVLRASGADEAMRLAGEHSGHIDLLLADVVMPGLSGPMLADRLLERRPGIRCLFMAGLPDTHEVQHSIVRMGRPFLAKPFFPEALLGKVRQVLIESGSGALATGA